MQNIKAGELIALFKQALSEQWGYIWGGVGQTWTQEKQNAATRDMTVKYGSKWIGRKVADCSGLFAWAFRQLGGSIYHGSNTIWNKHVSPKGALRNGIRTDGKPLLPGTALFLKKTLDGGINRHHIGLFIGEDTVIEAKGTQYGVVTSRPDHWHEWGELVGVDYADAAIKEKDTNVEAGANANAAANAASSDTVSLPRATLESICKTLAEALRAGA